MAEALLRQLGGDRFHVESAGTQPSRVHPLAAQTMSKRGLDLSRQRSKHMDELVGQAFDCVITVCDAANESCPIFPGAPERLHWSIPDPSAHGGDDAERLAAFERVAVELHTRIGYLVTVAQRRSN
jgi:arsenate reductase